MEIIPQPVPDFGISVFFDHFAVPENLYQFIRRLPPVFPVTAGAVAAIGAPGQNQPAFLG